MTTSSNLIGKRFVVDNGKRVAEGKRVGVVVRVLKDGVHAALLLDTGPKDYWYAYVADLVELAG